MEQSAQQWRAEGDAHYDAERWNQAGPAYERLLALDPRCAHAWYRLGNVRREQGNERAAAEYFERALAIDPAHARAWNNLGVSRQQLGRDALAAAAYRRALQHDPALLQALLNLGHLAGSDGDPKEAAALLERAAALDPSNAETWHALGRSLRQLRRSSEAATAFRASLERDSSRLDSYWELAGMAIDTGDLAAAEGWFAVALEKHPQDLTSRHMLSAMRGEAPPWPVAGYVEGLFDGMASSFDRQLVQTLEYGIPRLMADAVGPSLARARPACVLDLGCGTGLVGAALAGVGAQITGVDLSARMLEQAKQRNVYARLVQGDLVAELQKIPPGSLHAVLAADVFPYLGDLDAVFAATARALASSGVFTFSVELLESVGDYRLGSAGRYAHSASYLRALAARRGFAEDRLDRTHIRREKGKFIEGWLACFVIS